MVSIILPNLNTNIEFLKPRLQSIISQTINDWECIIIDGFSQNGSWEFLLDATREDRRFRAVQLPKRGIYNAWNAGIRMAQGEFIYIAPSDDTMKFNFLERMMICLKQNPSCDIANCCLDIIDEKGNFIVGNNWLDYISPRFFGTRIHQAHIRMAPHDGLLHAFIKTVYQSITQLLVRKKVFDEVGYFLENAGSIADFEWGMRVSLVRNVVHIPEHLASWRIHPEQATTESIQINPVTYKVLSDWVTVNINEFRKHAPAQFNTIKVKDIRCVYDHNRRYFRILNLGTKHNVLFRLYRKLFPKRARYLDGFEQAKQYFRENNLDKLVVII